MNYDMLINSAPYPFSSSESAPAFLAMGVYILPVTKTSYPILRAIMLKHAPLEMSHRSRIDGYGAVTAPLSLLSPPPLLGSGSQWVPKLGASTPPPPPRGIWATVVIMPCVWVSGRGPSACFNTWLLGEKGLTQDIIVSL